MDITDLLNNGIYWSHELDTLTAQCDGEKSHWDISVGTARIYSNNLTTSGGISQLYDLSQLIEDYFENNNITISPLNITYTSGDIEIEKNIYIIYSTTITNQNATEYIQHNFLTLNKIQCTYKKAPAQAYYIARGEVTPLIRVILKRGEQTKTTDIPTPSTDNIDYTLRQIDLSYQAVRTLVDQDDQWEDWQLIGWTCLIGTASITYYLTGDTPDLCFKFRNSFNVNEILPLKAITTFKTKLTYQQANCGRTVTQYDKQSELTFESKIGPIPLEMYDTIAALTKTDKVQILRAGTDTYDPVNIITDEIALSDKPLEENTITLKWTYSTTVQHSISQTFAERIFQTPFDPTYG